MNNNPTTELDAVNVMLETIGASPVARLDGVQNQDVIVARHTLKMVVQELQMEEWHFNTEKNFNLIPDTDGYINLPANIIRVQPKYHSSDVVVRGQKLYNRADHTYIFDADFLADITLCLPFDELPLEARTYVTIRAARKLSNNSVGDQQLETWTAQDEARARAAFVAADNRQANLGLGWKFKLDPVMENDFR